YAERRVDGNVKGWRHEPGGDHAVRGVGAGAMRDWLKRFLPYASLAFLIVFLSIASPYFATSGNISSVVRQTSVITIMAIGMTLVIASSGIDLSVGSMIGFTGVLGALLIARHEPVFVALLGAIAGGALCGLIN